MRSPNEPVEFCKKCDALLPLSELRKHVRNCNFQGINRSSSEDEAKNTLRYDEELTLCTKLLVSFIGSTKEKMWMIIPFTKRLKSLFPLKVMTTSNYLLFLQYNFDLIVVLEFHPLLQFLNLTALF